MSTFDPPPSSGQPGPPQQGEPQQGGWQQGGRPQGGPQQGQYPPPAAPAPPQPRSFRRGMGLGLGASLGAGLVLLVLGVIGSLVAGIVLVGAVSAAGGAATAQEPASTVWGSESASSTLRSVEVTGVILGDPSDGGAFGLGTYGYRVAEMIDDLDGEDADGLVLELNTPGGTIYGSRAIAEAVERYQERTGNQVLAYVRGISASGGMYAMAGADEIVVDHGTLVGSIGVIMGPFERYTEVTGLDGGLLGGGVTAEGGITSEYLTRGTGKDFGNPFRDMTEEEREVYGAGLQSEYEAFVSWVSEHRDIPEATIVDELGAHVYGPQAAVENGLADALGGRDAAFARAAELNDLDPADTRVTRVSAGGFWAELLTGRADGGVAGEPAGPAAAPPADASRPGAVCAGPPQVLAYHGDLAAVCGD